MNHLLTGVRCRATSVAKKHDKYQGHQLHSMWSKGISCYFRWSSHRIMTIESNFRGNIQFVNSPCLPSSPIPRSILGLLLLDFGSKYFPDIFPHCKTTMLALYCQFRRIESDLDSIAVPLFTNSIRRQDPKKLLWCCNEGPCLVWSAGGINCLTQFSLSLSQGVLEHFKSYSQYYFRGRT